MTLRNPPGPPMPREQVLDMARRHVTIGRHIVTYQYDLIARLKAEGRDTADAERTLKQFEASQAIFEEHLRAIETQREADGC